MRALVQIIVWRDLPKRIRCDNGPEYVSATVQQWAKDKGIQLAEVKSFSAAFEHEERAFAQRRMT